jgi:hypothetical protein
VLLQKLVKDEVIQPPTFLVDNTMMLTEMGSVAYGVSGATSDIDVYGYCLPPKDMVFPHLAGQIPGFGNQIQRFDSWQQHHCKAKDSDKEYDFTVFSIVKYFQLCMDNNPNVIDSLFVPRRCILHSTAIHEMVREKRHMFLHRGSYQKFKGYAYSNFHRYKDFNTRENLKELVTLLRANGVPTNTTTRTLAAELHRREIAHPLPLGGDVDLTAPTILAKVSDADLLKYLAIVNDLPKRDRAIVDAGYDTKAMYHVVRLCDEVEQVLQTGDLDLERSKEVLKSIRRGEWTLPRITSWFEDKEKHLEKVYAESTLRYGPDEASIKELLLTCLEHHYGSLDTAIKRDRSIDWLVRELKDLIARC